MNIKINTLPTAATNYKPSPLTRALAMKSGIPAISPIHPIDGNPFQGVQDSLNSQGSGGLYPHGMTGQEFYNQLPRSLQIDPHDVTTSPLWASLLGSAATTALFGGGKDSLAASGLGYLGSLFRGNGSGAAESGGGNTGAAGAAEAAGALSGVPGVGPATASIANDVSTGNIPGGIADSFFPGSGEALSFLRKDISPTNALAQQNLASSVGTATNPGAPEEDSNQLRNQLTQQGYTKDTAYQALAQQVQSGQISPDERDRKLAQLQTIYGY